MALPSTGSISMSQVRTELGRSNTITLNDSDVRSLAGKTSGTISMSDLRGKSSFIYTGTCKFAYWPEDDDYWAHDYSYNESPSTITVSGAGTFNWEITYVDGGTGFTFHFLNAKSQYEKFTSSSAEIYINNDKYSGTRLSKSSSSAITYVGYGFPNSKTWLTNKYGEDKSVTIKFKFV